MADKQREEETDVLRAEARELIRQARLRLDLADRIDSKPGRHRRVDRQGRRWYGHLWVAKTTAIGLLAGLWSVRRPAVAGAMGAAGIVAVPVALDTPLPPAQSALPPVIDWGGEQRPPEPARDEEPTRYTYVEVPVEPDPPQPEPTIVAQMPDPQPPPTVTVTPEPDPEPEPEPEPTPEPKPTVDVDVDLDPLEVCAELGLPPAIGLDLCLEELDRLDIDLDALGLDLNLDLGLGLGLLGL